MLDFEVNFLDHVAIRVRDIDVSVKWYEKNIGLKSYKLKEWGDYPVFLLAGKSGLALFPRRSEDTRSISTIVDHFAFNVSNESFLKAQLYLKKVSIDFVFKDHHYFHSIYLKDPDNHTVELTTLMVEESAFYTKGK